MARKKVVRSKASKSGSANKTTLTGASVPKYIASIADEGRRADCRALIKLMTAVTRKPPRMWGSSIVGFGQYHYKYESGREGDICLAGFSSRKADLTIYVMTRSQEDLLARLGKHRASKACVYVKHLADVDTAVLRKLIATSVAAIKRLYP